MVDIEELRAHYLNVQFDRKDFELDAANMIAVARACCETKPMYLDPEHPDFQALPSYIGSLASGRHLPVDFPSLGGIPMDGGKAVQCFAPVRPGVKLVGSSHLHDIYDKTGRSGRMIFLVSRMELHDTDGNHLATNDSRMVVREERMMTVRTVRDVEFGAELPVFEPDTSLDAVRPFAVAVGWIGGGRFSDHDKAREEGLPGALVPGLMAMGFLTSMIHRWCDAAVVESVDTVFRAPLIADEPATLHGVVTDIDEDTGVVEIDLTVKNAAAETRVMGTARVRVPT